MTIALWIVQILLALGFALSGFEKVSQPAAKLWVKMNTRLGRLSSLEKLE